MLKRLISNLPAERKSKVWIFSSLNFEKLYIDQTKLCAKLQNNKNKKDDYFAENFKQVIDQTTPSLIELDIILFPIHSNNHWSLVVYLKADTNSIRFLHLDSLGQHYKTEIMQTLKLYLLQKFTEQVTTADYVRLTNCDSTIQYGEMIKSMLEADQKAYQKVRAISLI